MKIASLADVKARFSAYVTASEEEAVIVTRNGKPAAVLLGVDDEDELERMVFAHSPQLRAILEASKQEIREGRGVPHDDFWAAVDSEDQKPRRRKRAVRT